MWVPVWGLQDQTSVTTSSTLSNNSNQSFKDILLDKIKRSKEKPVKKRRKIDSKTKVFSDEAYLAEIERLEKEDQEKRQRKLLKTITKRTKSKKLIPKKKIEMNFMMTVTKFPKKRRIL